MIAGVLLAAGHGSRFGSDKRLHDVAGRPLISYALNAAVNARLGRTYVVLGPHDAEVKDAITSSLSDSSMLCFVENNQPQLGMMSSLKAALTQLPQQHEAAMVIHADMPLVTCRLVNRLIEAFERSDAIVLPRCDGRWQHPRVIPRWLFGEFLSLADNERGTGILDRHPDRTTIVQVKDPDIFLDVDSPRDLERVKRIFDKQKHH